MYKGYGIRANTDLMWVVSCEQTLELPCHQESNDLFLQKQEHNIHVLDLLVSLTKPVKGSLPSPPLLPAWPGSSSYTDTSSQWGVHTKRHTSTCKRISNSSSGICRHVHISIFDNELGYLSNKKIRVQSCDVVFVMLSCSGTDNKFVDFVSMWLWYSWYYHQSSTLTSSRHYAGRLLAIKNSSAAM